MVHAGPQASAWPRVTCGAWGLHLSVGLLTRCLPTQLAVGGSPPSSGHPHQLPAAWRHGALARVTHCPWARPGFPAHL